MNAPHHIQNGDDARKTVAVIVDLRNEIEGLTGQFKPMLDDLTEKLEECRGERDAQIKPLADRMDSLRAELLRWLKDDPDGQVKDASGAVLATVTRGKAKVEIDDAKVPVEYQSMQPDRDKIAVALAMKTNVPGVTVTRPLGLTVR